MKEGLFYLKTDPAVITVRLSFLREQEGSMHALREGFFHGPGTPTYYVGHMPKTEVYQHCSNY